MLEVVGLTKVFTLHGLGGRELVGCSEVSFSLDEGCFVALMGVSGAGKSTVLKCLYRTYLPTAGRLAYRTAAGDLVDLARLDDRAILALRRTEMAYVPQFLRVVPRVSALEVVAESLILAGESAREARHAAGSMLERLRLPAELWDAFPVNFSGGEKQRVSVARACLRRPRLLFIDEPTASLDPETKHDVVVLLRELKEEGVATVAILHDREVVEHLADEVVHMAGGRVCRAIS